jgi:hypothetical protein
MAKSHLKPVTPTTVKRTVTPRRRQNGDLRTREYLTEHEVERLIDAAKRNRHGHRDATMVLVTYRHGLRAAEVVDLRWDQVDFKTATLHVRRVATSYGRCVGSSANRNDRPSCSPRNAARRSAPPVSPAWSSARASRPSLALRSIPTCSGTPAATPWPTGGTTPGRCKPTWGTRTSSIRCATPSYPPRGLRTFGGSKRRP